MHHELKEHLNMKSGIISRILLVALFVVASTFFDYFMPAKYEGKWRIVQKAYTSIK